MQKAITFAALIALAAIPILVLAARRQPAMPVQSDPDNIFEDELAAR